MGQRSYTPEYRANAVALAKEIDASAAARQLKIPADTLYTWTSREKRRCWEFRKRLPCSSN